MARCSACGTTILFGGKRVGDFRFCSDKCLARGRYLTFAARVPDAMVDDLARRTVMGACPKCKGPGPIDVHNAYSVWSAVYLTSWKTQPHIACKTCGRRAQVQALFFSFFFGWWGIPFGFILTPVQIARNIGAIRRESSLTEPSPDLLRVARLTLAAQLAAQAAAAPQ